MTDNPNTFVELTPDGEARFTITVPLCQIDLLVDVVENKRIAGIDGRGLTALLTDDQWLQLERAGVDVPIAKHRMLPSNSKQVLVLYAGPRPANPDVPVTKKNKELARLAHHARGSMHYTGPFVARGRAEFARLFGHEGQAIADFSVLEQGEAGWADTEILLSRRDIPWAWLGMNLDVTFGFVSPALRPFIRGEA